MGLLCIPGDGFTQRASDCRGHGEVTGTEGAPPGPSGKGPERSSLQNPGDVASHGNELDSRQKDSAGKSCTAEAGTAKQVYTEFQTQKQPRCPFHRQMDGEAGPP